MDLLENPEIKSTYDKCKYVVKLWEHNFTKTHGRLPSKLDIREADRKVRAAYRQYYQLKTAALEQSFKGVDGFNSDDENNEKVPENSPAIETNDTVHVETVEEPASEVWGSHLDNKPEKRADDDKPNFNTTLSKKLFCGSKLSKRYSRKSSSFSQKKNESSSFDNSVLSQPTQSFTESSSAEKDRVSFEGIFNKSNVKIVAPSEKVTSQSTNIVQSVLDNKYKPLKSVDSGWLERVGMTTGVEIEKSSSSMCNEYLDETMMHLNYDSDDIIDNSDEENSVNLGHTAKRARLDISQKVDSVTENMQTQNSEINVSEEKNINLSDEKSKNQDITNNINESKVVVDDPFEFKEDAVLDNSDIPNTPKNKLKKTTPRTTKKRKTNPRKKVTEEPPTIRVSRRSTKTKVNMVESHSENEDPFHSDNDSNDPEFSLSKEKTKYSDLLTEENREDTLVDTSKKRKPRAKKVAQLKENNEEETESTYELEYSIKPRISAPRFKNIKKLIKIETSTKIINKEETKENKPQIKSKREQEKEKLQKKIQSGSLNENFITINLKKKIYSRGKKNMNFSRYKKQQWKNKKKALAGPDMDMGGCDGGMLTCFNCGDVGHFARNCPKTKGDTLLPLEADEEVCPFPTLEDASKMAKESSLAIRKSNMVTTSESQEDTLDGSDDDIFDDGDTDLLLAETLKLEEHFAKLDLQSYLDYVTVVEPYYKTNEDGMVIETPEEVFSALKKFGHSSFRPGQEQAVMRILSGKSTLVTLSTGSGKSLCYQLPAYLYSRREPCISLIISPLVSLMEDQVTGIPAFLKAACLHTNQTKVQRQKVLELISSGLLNVLLVSPEAVVAGEKQTGFGSLLRKLPPIAFACIDEAHCVSQWSHNFRPSYLLICRVLRERMGVKTVLGLTATATRSTSDSIVEHLQIPDGRNGIISDIPLPDNLILTVSKDHQRDQALLALLTSERFTNCKSIIVYCTRREECNRVTKFLRTSLQYEQTDNKKRKRISVQAEPYHAGLSASRRRTIQKAFMSGELRIVVATVAFGMGINKSDIRAVIHYNMPKNFESYVQEIGRAGRDGLPAHCHLFLDAKGNDENELRRHIYANSIDRHVIRKLLQKIFLPCSCKETCPKHEVAFSIEETNYMKRSILSY
ncbi:uncharacterized protein LOC135134983 isoform X2 [Zophobas morio]|uniref:uncharacterized protein LOC135134983 isoform X2 n=1 Tax=Zophobas morio TaxID=2755281 RepID=UPI0030830336